MITVFRGGIVYPNAAAADIVVSGGTITAIGGNTPVTAPERVISLAGAYVYPGFHDAHCHLLSLLEREFVLDLSGAAGFDDLHGRAKQYIERFPGSGIVGKGLNETAWPDRAMPTAADLDTIDDGRPLVFYRICGHVAAVNSDVLRRLPLLRKTAPDGIVSENDLDLIQHLIPAPSPETRCQALKALLERLSACGLTAVSSNDLGRFASAEDEALFLKAKDDIAARLNVRVQYTPALDFDAAELDRLDDALVGPNPAVKVFVDGSLGGRTALLREPYSDDPSARGVVALDRGDHLKIARAAAERGLQMMSHAIGDEALARTLDVYEQVTERGNPLRHAVVHAQIADDALLERMARLQIVAIVQPSFTASDREMAVMRLGSRTDRAYRFRTMAERGIPLAFSSDAPVESIRPLASIAAAMAADGRAEERFSFAEALACQTRGAAYADFLETTKGTLAPGADADFVVFAENLADVPPHRLPSLEPILTVKGGEVTFARPASP